MTRVPHSLFISDLHLCASRAAINQQLMAFLRTQAAEADALYILGDLFEYWAGDDDISDAFNQTIIQSFRHLSQSGTQVFVMHGNRDFLMGDALMQASGAHFLPDPTPVTLYGYSVLLSHGDALCTDDVKYQQFREQVRQPAWQQAFLRQPLASRKAQIEALRQRSEAEKSHKSVEIMDVNAQAVDALMRHHYYPQLFIHGHTHRPATHHWQVDGHRIERWVLGDWYEQGSCLRLDATGCQNQVIFA